MLNASHGTYFLGIGGGPIGSGSNRGYGCGQFRGRNPGRRGDGDWSRNRSRLQGNDHLGGRLPHLNMQVVTYNDSVAADGFKTGAKTGVVVQINTMATREPLAEWIEAMGWLLAPTPN